MLMRHFLDARQTQHFDALAQAFILDVRIDLCCRNGTMTEKVLYPKHRNSLLDQPGGE